MSWNKNNRLLFSSINLKIWPADRDVVGLMADNVVNKISLSPARTVCFTPFHTNALGKDRNLLSPQVMDK